MGLAARIFADKQSIITSAFTRHLCALFGIEQHQSVIYYPSSNGRAEAAVKPVVMALQKFLHERPGKWIQALPLAVWGLNDLPGLIAPYSPHRFVFGRDPVGFGDVCRLCPGMGLKMLSIFLKGLRQSVGRSGTVSLRFMIACPGT